MRSPKDLFTTPKETQARPLDVRTVSAARTSLTKVRCFNIAAKQKMLLKPKVVKTLSVLEEVACENTWFSIECPPGNVLNILTANYGRRDKTTCSNGLPEDNFYLQNTKCSSVNSSILKVKSACQGKSRCQILTDNPFFGEPCGNTIKYLQVKYTCKTKYGGRWIKQIERKTKAYPNRSIVVAENRAIRTYKYLERHGIFSQFTIISPTEEVFSSNLVGIPSYKTAFFIFTYSLKTVHSAVKQVSIDKIIKP